MAITRETRQEALSYQLLMARAERCGVPTSLDDPATPRTVAGLLGAVQAAEAVSCVVCPTCFVGHPRPTRRSGRVYAVHCGTHVAVAS